MLGSLLRTEGAKQGWCLQSAHVTWITGTLSVRSTAEKEWNVRSTNRNWYCTRTVWYHMMFSWLVSVDSSSASLHPLDLINNSFRVLSYTSFDRSEVSVTNIRWPNSSNNRNKKSLEKKPPQKTAEKSMMQPVHLTVRQWSCFYVSSGDFCFHQFFKPNLNARIRNMRLIISLRVFFSTFFLLILFSPKQWCLDISCCFWTLFRFKSK